MLGGVVLAMLACLACGADNDVLINPPPPAPAPIVPPPADNTDNTDDTLDDADQLTSGGDAGPADVDGGSGDGGACGVCPTPASGASCCTAEADISAVRATEAGACGIDMAEFGFPGCTQLAQPGVLDEACPPVEFPPGAPPMAGCCTAAGHCGAMETFMGFGCTSNPDPSTWVPCGG